MEKQIVEDLVQFGLKWTRGVSIEFLRSELNRLEKLGATKINIECQEMYGVTGVIVAAYKEREETEEECVERLEQEKWEYEQQRKKDLKMLKALKEKCEGINLLEGLNNK